MMASREDGADGTGPVASFDRRVVPEPVLELVRACQHRAASCHLAGGAGLSGVYLRHRLSADVDLFCHQRDDVRTLVRELPDIASERGVRIALVQDAGSFARATVHGLDRPLHMDFVYEPVPDLEPPAAAVDGVWVESLRDLRASKVTCLLNRTEPRDLVDLLVLDRAGHPPEQDLASALEKDAGIDPGILAWLLRDFPTAPLPSMLVPLAEPDLRRFRDELRERLRRIAVPE
jgi:hypothetical protein